MRGLKFMTFKNEIENAQSRIPNGMRGLKSFSFADLTAFLIMWGGLFERGIISPIDLIT